MTIFRRESLTFSGDVRNVRATGQALRPRVAGMQTFAQAALAKQQGFLQAVAVAELKAQRDRLNTYMIQARFSLASIYDRAAARVEPADAPQAALVEGGQ